jgi:hypothetical protein
MDTPLDEFHLRPGLGEDGRTTGHMVFPHGDGKAHEVLRSLQSDVDRTYEELIATGISTGLRRVVRFRISAAVSEDTRP